MATTNTTTTRNKKLFYSGIILILSAVLIVCFLLFKEQDVIVNNGDEQDYHTMEYNGTTYDYDSSVVSFLFMGIDTTDSETLGQADAIYLVLMNRDTETIDVVPISRDTMTEIHLYDVEYNDLGWDTQHLGLAYAYGSSPKNGAMLTTQAVSRLLYDVPINYFAALDLSNLTSIQNIVGTLDVVAPNDSYEGVAAGETVTITAENVESFVRTRDIEQDYSNTDRMERQKAYLNAYMLKLKDLLSNDFENTVKVLYNTCSDMVTNVTLDNIQSFANMLLTYSYDSDSNYHTIAGEDASGAFHDEFNVDQDKLRELVVHLFYEEEELK